jgi:hypothetical protein
MNCNTKLKRVGVGAFPTPSGLTDQQSYVFDVLHIGKAPMVADAVLNLLNGGNTQQRVVNTLNALASAFVPSQSNHETFYAFYGTHLGFWAVAGNHELTSVNVLQFDFLAHIVPLKL